MTIKLIDNPRALLLVQSRTSKDLKGRNGNRERRFIWAQEKAQGKTQLKAAEFLISAVGNSFSVMMLVMVMISEDDKVNQYISRYFWKQVKIIGTGARTG